MSFGDGTLFENSGWIGELWGGDSAMFIFPSMKMMPIVKCDGVLLSGINRFDLCDIDSIGKHGK